MHDQADHLRQLVRDAAVDGPGAACGQTIVLSGAREEIGVTTLTVDLARELALLGKQVVLVDGNLRRPRLAEVLRIRPRDTLCDVLSGDRSAAEAVARTPDGTLLLAGVQPDQSPPLDGSACERFAAEIALLARHADVLLVDAGAGMQPWVDRLWRVARQILVAIDPEPASMLDAYGMLKQAQYHRLDRKVQLLAMRADERFDLAALEERFAYTCQRFLCIEPHRARQLPPRDEAPARDSHSHYARSVRLLAADLVCEARPTPRTPPRFAVKPPRASSALR